MRERAIRFVNSNPEMRRVIEGAVGKLVRLPEGWVDSMIDDMRISFNHDPARPRVAFFVRLKNEADTAFGAEVDCVQYLRRAGYGAGFMQDRPTVNDFLGSLSGGQTELIFERIREQLDTTELWGTKGRTIDRIDSLTFEIDPIRGDQAGACHWSAYVVGLDSRFGSSFAVPIDLAEAGIRAGFGWIPCDHPDCAGRVECRWAFWYQCPPHTVFTSGGPDLSPEVLRRVEDIVGEAADRINELVLSVPVLRSGAVLDLRAPVEGDEVIALMRIIDSGEPVDPTVVAEPGDRGVVVHVEPDVAESERAKATVRFYRTGKSSWVLFPCNVAGTVRKSEVAYLDYSDLGAARQPAASGGSAAPTTSGGSGGGVS